MNTPEPQTSVSQTPRDKDLDMEFEESGVGKKFNFALMIDLGLNRILALSAKQTTPENSMMMVNDLRRAISIYSRVIRPYYNKEYRTRMEEAKTKYEDDRDSLVGRSRDLSPQAFNKMINDIEFEYVDEMMNALTELMESKDLLLKERIALREGFSIVETDTIRLKKLSKTTKKPK